MQEVMLDDIASIAEPLGFEVPEDFGQGVPLPFGISDFAGSLHNECCVISRSDKQTGVLGLSHPVEDAVPVVGIEGVHAAGFVHQQSINGHGFEAELFCSLENMIGSSGFQGLD
jgi:hypothetical protein